MSRQQGGERGSWAAARAEHASLPWPPRSSPAMPHHPHPRTCTAPAGVSFVVQPGEKVGIVGRTGSGKSSLIVTLFRMVEPYQGSIVLDGRNLLSLGLDDVRGRIAAIPQVGGRRGWAAVAGGGRARGEGGGGRTAVSAMHGCRCCRLIAAP